MTQNNFSKILLSAVEESLSSLGDSPKQAILFHLEASFNLKKEKIPTNLTEFAKALEGIFGPGASYLERLIVKRLYEKLGLKFEEMEGLDFLKCVDNVKKRILVEGECITR
ncbi:MAG: hypothetical protein QHH17_01850 [Candidatus Bathyarchaeota archaeon]|nr:hypothetical protein [Candidatus Bathyarchaeota archaeon]